MKYNEVKIILGISGFVIMKSELKRIKEGHFKNQETGLDYFSISSFKKEYKDYNDSEYSNDTFQNQKDSDELAKLDYIEFIDIPFGESPKFEDGLAYNEDGLFKFFKTKGFVFPWED
jgi:hypothetical protein